MYLKNLTLRGFKSFASATALRFEPGITCVVGPNGSGKSNVVDALAWVMGEQGAKTLRGGKMEDVIFAGTSSRAALGRAEVSLTIDNADGALPIDYSEVTVRRTLFRNGGSEYAINGDTCRLLDVQELLSDSGIGREMHVIVGQGQLDTVLHAGPEERRALIEEAAGILKHRKRKEKALRKLDAMQGNLDRVTDLTAELRRQLKPLGRQAELARRAAVIQAELRDARLRLLADDITTLSETLRKEEADEATARRKREEVDAALEAAQQRETDLEEEATRASPLLERARETSLNLQRLRERFGSLAELATERQRGLSSDESQDASHRTDPEELEREAAEVRAEEVELTEHLTETQENLEAAVAERKATEEQLAREDKAVAAAARAAADRREQVAKLHGQVDSVRSRVAASAAEIARLTDTAQEARERAEIAAEELERGRSETEDSADPDLAEEQERTTEQLRAAEARLKELREVERRTERERAAIAARKEALEQGIDRKDATAALLAAEQELPGLLGPLSSQVQVESGTEAAVAAALGVAAEAVAVTAADTALAAVDLLKERDAGRAGIVVADEGLLSVPDRDSWPTPPPDCAYLVDRISAPDKLRPALLQLLDQTVLVPDTARAAKLLRERPQARAVTVAGDVFTAAFTHGGSSSVPSAIEAQAAVDEAAMRLEEVAAACEQAALDLAEAEEARQEAADAVSAVTARVRAEEKRRSEAGTRVAQLEAHARAAASEAERGTRAIEKATGSQAEDEERLAELEERLQQVEAEPVADTEPDTALRDELAQQASAARAAETEGRLAVRTAEERVRALASRAETLEATAVEAREAQQRAAERRVDRQRRATVAAAIADAARTAAIRVEESLQVAESRRQREEEARSAREPELKMVRQKVRDLSVERESLVNTAHSTEMARAERRMRLEQLHTKAVEELGIEVEPLLAEYGPSVSVPPSVDAGEGAEPLPFERAVQEKRARSNERQLAQLGKVNPLALEEFAAMEERHAFLSTQLEDLKSTRRDLLEVVKQVDDRVREVFAGAYADVEREFSAMFGRLFPGGEGRLVLTDSEDMLTSGIEVEARPPGKKVKRLSLLSGGERSLTAIAFLAAIFKARPSPFYVLDEVEAALDDTNLQRLLIIFEELRSSSQLIVITHQKRTMEAADALYGVTMRGDGISEVISQRLERTAS